MKYVYLLQSTAYPKRRYIGITSDLSKRLKNHNSGKSPHTAKYLPWKIVVAIRFEDDTRALVFGKYLKTGSGHTLAKRAFWPDYRKRSFLGHGAPRRVKGLVMNKARRDAS